MPRARKELPPDAANIMLAGITAGKDSAAISAEILAATGEIISGRTIARRASEWRVRCQTREAATEKALAIISAVKKSGVTGDEFIHAQIVEQLMDRPEQIAADPKLALQAGKLKEDRRRNDIRERSLAVDERKVTVLEDREKRARQQIADLLAKVKRGGQVTADELERLDREYGLAA
jgi:hypothetical protein